MPADATWVASDELKAFETLSCAQPERIATIRRDPRLNEVMRPDEPFDDEVIARRSAWVEERLDDRHATWERPEEVGLRVSAAISSYTDEADVLVVASHGMAITALLVQLGRIEAGPAAGEFWRELAMPAVIEIDL